VGVAVFAPCWILNKPWMTVPIFLVLAVIACFIWIRVLGRVDQIANQRKDTLIATLMKTS
jgi:membrane protein implicated in regulation of membrane protease activity